LSCLKLSPINGVEVLEVSSNRSIPVQTFLKFYEVSTFLDLLLFFEVVAIIPPLYVDNFSYIWKKQLRLVVVNIFNMLNN
jgi:hypothetical protein